MPQSEERYFTKLFEEAAIAKFTPNELREYENSLKAYRDVKNSIDTAIEMGREEGLAEGMAKGRSEGIAEGREEVARAMLKKGMDSATIAELTGISEEEIKRL